MVLNVKALPGDLVLFPSGSLLDAEEEVPGCAGAGSNEEIPD